MVPQVYIVLARYSLSFQNSYEQNVSRKLNFDGTGDVRRSPITALPGSRQSSECSDTPGLYSPPTSLTLPYI